MKIAVFFHDCEVTSGATASMVTLVEYWHKMGEEIYAYAPYDGILFDKLRSIGIRCNQYKTINSRYNRGRNIFRQLSVRAYSIIKIPAFKKYVKSELVEELKNERIDIVYANTSACVVGYYIKQYIEIPLIWHVREFGDLDQNVSYVGGKSKLFKMLAESDLLIFISKAIASYYKKAAIKTKSIMVYNDLSANYDVYQEKDFARKPVRLLSCGALNPGKGHLDVLRAVALLKERNCDVILNIAGSGDLYMPLYTSLINELGINDRVNLLGQVKDMSTLRKECEIGVVASKMEAFGRVTVEGMLAGMVMVGANTGGTAELIENDETGLTFRTGDVKQIADCIEELLNDPLKASRLSMEGYEFAKQFIKGNCAKIIHEELKKIIDE